jgi:hypothetical protein
MFLWSSECLADHPLRGVRKVTDAVLDSLSPDLDKPYGESG